MRLGLDPHFKSIHTPATMINITPSQLRKAADIKERIDVLQSELNEILGSDVSTPAQSAKAPTKKGKMSAAGRAAIRAAQKARWAKIKGIAKPGRKARRRMSAKGLANIRAGVAKRMAAQGKAPTAKPAKKAKKKFSAAARAALAAAAKARWAKAKAAGKSRL
jgi:hypothetical protein